MQTALIISEDTLNIDYLNLKVQKENFLLHLKGCKFRYSDDYIKFH